jgi:hypothetical protein
VEVKTMLVTDQTIDTESAARQNYQTVPCPECSNPMTTWETHDCDEDDIGPMFGKVVKHTLHTPGSDECIINQVVFNTVPLRNHLRQLKHTLEHIISTHSKEIDPGNLLGVVSSMTERAEKVVDVFKRYSIWHDPIPKKGEYTTGEGI